MIDDWLNFVPETAPEGSETSTAVAHLHILRTLLARDYLAKAGWLETLVDLARMVQHALDARQALVALPLETPQHAWMAVAHTGERLSDVELSSVGSRSALEQVRSTGQPLIHTEALELAIDSVSVRAHQATSMLVVPFFFWNPRQPEAGRTLGGCLYAHRILGEPAFEPRHIELVTDIARIAQPILNLLRELRTLEETLTSTRENLSALQERSRQEFRLGAYTSHDPWFAREVLEPLKRVSAADKLNLLLLGPTGSGKTHLAEAWHFESSRKAGPFVVMDCAQVTSVETLSAELFGYAPDSGYANSPRQGRPGKAQLAHKGTLFIDEIACLQSELQQKLLRLIERGEFTPLGGSEVRKVDIQIVAATLEDLPGMVREKRFREDLYWRLTDLVLTLPPLSERPLDIPALASTFLQSAARRSGRRELKHLSDKTLQALLRYDWSRAGNIRGLERTLFRSVLMAPPGTRRLEPEHLQLQALDPAGDRGPGRVDLGSSSAPDPISRADTPVQPSIRQPPSAISKPPRTPAASPLVSQPPESPPATGSDRRGPGWHHPALERLSPSEREELETIRATIRAHGYATSAARALGMTYRELTWRLHRVGLSIRDMLNSE